MLLSAGSQSAKVIGKTRNDNSSVQVHDNQQPQWAKPGHPGLSASGPILGHHGRVGAEGLANMHGILCRENWDGLWAVYSVV